MIMDVCIIGMGKIGHGTAAALASKGIHVTCFTRNEHKLQSLNKNGISASGSVYGTFKVQTTNDLRVATRADLLIIATTAQGHRPVAKSLKGHLKKNQVILILTGNWGAYEFFSELNDEIKEKDVIIGETSGNIAAVPKLSPNSSVFIKPPKKTIDFATIPSFVASEIKSELHEIFPQLIPVKNVLTTSLNNTNSLIHVAVSLFNITRIANRETAAFYLTSMPELVVNFIEDADRERVLVGKAIGADTRPVLELLNNAWESDYKSLKTLGMENKSLQNVFLPKTVRHRFLTEDVPFGCLPIAQIGAKAKIQTPRIKLMVDTYRYLLCNGREIQGPIFDLPFSKVI